MEHNYPNRAGGCTNRIDCEVFLMEEKKVRPQDKWNAKAGYVSKSYKLKKEVTEQFAKACEKAGVSQAGKLTELMKNFIEEVNTTE